MVWREVGKDHLRVSMAVRVESCGSGYSVFAIFKHGEKIAKHVDRMPAIQVTDRLGVIAEK